MKSQDFVDLRALASAQGIAVQPFADDLKAELSVDKVLLARPERPDACPTPPRRSRRPWRTRVTFDSKRWQLDRDADYTKRQFDLVRAAAEAPFTGRTARAARSRAVLFVAAVLSRGQGRARHRDRRRPPDRRGSGAAGAARRRQHHARPRR